MVRDTPPSEDASTHQIKNSYLKECKRYAPGTLILKTRSEVEGMVTVTRKWYLTLGHPKIHLHTKFGIPFSKNIGDMHQTQCRFWKQGPKYGDLNMVRETLSSQDASIHQILDSYLE